MSETAPFAVFHAEKGEGHARDAAQMKGSERARGHEKEAVEYLAQPPLVDALNAAWHTHAPLLLTGEPGTGKTQAAFWAALAIGAEVHPLWVTSSTTSQQLLYDFDRVGQFHAAQDKTNPLVRKDFRKMGPLWRAFATTEGPSVVLIDEIDKAPRDFPNDLLHVLDQHQFQVDPNDHDADECAAPPWVIQQQWSKHPPLVVVTSNSERRLPEAFLRRCIFHHLQMTPTLVDRVLERRRKWFPGLPAEAVEAARTRFYELRALDLSKPPATAELLLWLSVLAARKIDAQTISSAPLGALPSLACLIKHGEDLNKLPGPSST